MSTLPSTYCSLISLNDLEGKFTIQTWVPEEMHVVALCIFYLPVSMSYDIKPFSESLALAITKTESLDM